MGVIASHPKSKKLLGSKCSSPAVSSKKGKNHSTTSARAKTKRPCLPSKTGEKKKFARWATRLVSVKRGKETARGKNS